MFTILAEAEQTAASGFPTIIMLVVWSLFSIIFMIRPENKKKKAAEEMRNALKSRR